MTTKIKALETLTKGMEKMKKAQDWSEYDKAAAAYGLGVNQQGRIIDPVKGNETGIILTVKQGRLRAEMVSTGDLIASFANKPEKLEIFIEQFWYREKRAA